MAAEAISVKELRNRAKPMYHDIGIGKVLGFFIFISYFTVLPAFLRLIWPLLFTKYESKLILM